MHSSWTDQLRQLATLDATQRVFGARGKNKGWGHNYSSQLLSEAEVVDFEQWCGCKLPDSYREYLLTVGVGAGPFYGLMPLDKIKEELGYIYESYAELGQVEVGRPGRSIRARGNTRELGACASQMRRPFSLSTIARRFYPDLFSGLRVYHLDGDERCTGRPAFHRDPLRRGQRRLVSRGASTRNHRVSQTFRLLAWFCAMARLCNMGRRVA